MKKNLVLAAFLFLFFSAQAQSPTWSDNIACIVYTHCTKCHNPNGIAPSNFLDYNLIKPYGLAIKNAVNDKRMPPYPPDLSYQRYAHERYLTQEEVDLINAWVDSGMAEGNSANAPAPPQYSGISELTNIDLTVQMPTYTNNKTADDYRCFVIPLNLTEDKFITSYEILPGNRNMVHHVLVFLDTTGTAETLDAQDPGVGYTSFGGIGTSSAILIGGWVPGSRASFLPQGMGIKMYKNAKLVMQMHYPAGTFGDIDSTKINFTLTNNPSTRLVRIMPILNHVLSITNGPLSIPANTVKTFYAEYSIPANLTLLSVAPHMHMIGRSIKVFGVTLSNDTIPLINIPNWNFHWQGFYPFKKPVKIPSGTKLYCEATYDNTTNNPFQPSNPPQLVTAGEATTDEMMLVYFSFLIYQNGDENIVVDTATSIATYNNCNYELTTGMAFIDDKKQVDIFPAPIQDKLTVRNYNDFAVTVSLFDISGKNVLRTDAPANETLSINTANLENGIYFIKVTDVGRNILQQRKVVKM